VGKKTGIRRRVKWQIVWDVSEKITASIFMVKLLKENNLLGRIRQNNKALYPRGLSSSGIQVFIYIGHIHTHTHTHIYIYIYLLGSTAACYTKTSSLLRLHDPTQTHHTQLRLLWTRDQPVAETSTRQHTTLTIDRYP
jgi:hypothetical protein